MRMVLEIQGIEQLDRKLQLLPIKVERTIIRQAVRAAQKVTLALVKARTLALPVSQRWRGAHKALIAGAWKLAVPKKQIPGSYAIHVILESLDEFWNYGEGAHTRVSYTRQPSGKIKRKIGKTVGRSWWPAAIEYDHGMNKEQAARPFARPAAEESHDEVIAVLVDELRRGIEDAAMADEFV